MAARVGATSSRRKTCLARRERAPHEKKFERDVTFRRGAFEPLPRSVLCIEREKRRTRELLRLHDLAAGESMLAMHHDDPRETPEHRMVHSSHGQFVGHEPEVSQPGLHTLSDVS